jgi:hypothetical protein
VGYNGICKRSVESCVYFDADELHHHVVKMGRRITFVATCRNERRIVLVVQHGLGLTIVQSFDGETVTSSLDMGLEATETPIGGFRHWFRCPRCRARRKRLYIVPFVSLVACRVCFGLVHRSTQLNRRPHMGLAMLVSRGTGFTVGEVAAEMGKWWREDPEARRERRRNYANRRRRDIRALAASASTVALSDQEVGGSNG